jgi:hypothetical protein
MRQRRDEKQAPTGCYMDLFLTQILESSTDGGPDNPIFTLANLEFYITISAVGCLLSMDELRGLVLDLHLTLLV